MTDSPISDTRARVVEIARSQICVPNARNFWEVCGKEPYSAHHSWCGIFALWCLRQAGIADFDWEFGKGFLYRLPRTLDPQPGDIGYIDQPYQHHLVMESVSPVQVRSIDGNTPTVSTRARRPAAITQFYSIEPLILAAHAREAYP